jgi:hypothetical protein
VKDLRQLVEATPTQEAADPGDPWIPRDLEDRPLSFVQVLQLRLEQLRADDHCPELEHTEPTLAQTHPLLREEDRPTRVEFDRKGDQADDGYQHRQHRNDEYEIHTSLHKKLPFLLGDGFERQ